MAQLTISAAARLCHMARRTLQRAIHAGRLHLDAQHGLSTDELLLAGYLIAETPQDAPPGTPQHAPQETPLLPLLERLALVVENLTQEVRQPREPLCQVPQGLPQEAPQEIHHESAPLSQPTPQEVPQSPSSRGAMRQRIIALLREHPEGLFPLQIRQ
jgi:hypothetical protein